MERKNNSEVTLKPHSYYAKHLFEGVDYTTEDFSITAIESLEKNCKLPQHAKNSILVIVVCHGRVKIVNNHRSSELHKNDIALIRCENMPDEVRLSKACEGYAISFSKKFLESKNIGIIDHISSMLLFGNQNCITLYHEDAEELNYAINIVIGSLRHNYYLYSDKISSSLITGYYYLLVSILSLQSESKRHQQRQGKGHDLIINFIELVNEQCERERCVERYAEQLGVSSKYLSLLCKRKTGKNPLKIIDEAVLNKAKELLMQSGMTINEVSRRLNFVSQSFFGKYFKQRVGISPSRYKVQHEK